MSKATPRPWHLFPSNKLCIEAADGNVGLCNLARASFADAELIVRAVNCHDELLEALIDLLSSEKLDDGNPILERARSAASAAIRKATEVKP